jgi:hypothetical protein
LTSGPVRLGLCVSEEDVGTAFDVMRISDNRKLPLYGKILKYSEVHELAASVAVKILKRARFG